ncbi:hypothetical protein HDV62DRAFT_392230 [Trichoderma sp. SZMC 28011]
MVHDTIQRGHIANMVPDFIDNGDDDNSSQRSFHTANDYLDGDDNGSEYSWHSALNQ